MLCRCRYYEGSEKAESGSVDGAEEVLSESEISSLALYILRCCDENRKKNRLAGKDTATMSDLSESSISLKVGTGSTYTTRIPVYSSELKFQSSLVQ